MPSTHYYPVLFKLYIFDKIVFYMFMSTQSHNSSSLTWMKLIIDLLNVSQEKYDSCCFLACRSSGAVIYFLVLTKFKIQVQFLPKSHKNSEPPVRWTRHFGTAGLQIYRFLMLANSNRRWRYFEKTEGLSSIEFLALCLPEPLKKFLHPSSYMSFAWNVLQATSTVCRAKRKQC